RRVTIPLPLGAWRGPAGGIVWVLAVLSGLPVAGLVLKASAGGFAGVPAWIGASLTNSIVSAGVAATIIAALGLVVGHGLARGRAGSRLLDAAGALAFVTPAAVLGVGLISLWNRPATQVVYGSLAIIVIGDLARYGVVGVRDLQALFAQVGTCELASVVELPGALEADAVIGTGRRRLLLGALALWAALTIFSRLGGAPVYIINEGREGVYVRAMLDTGDWILPSVPNHVECGETIPDKPPLFHWIAGAATGVRGALASGRVLAGSELSR